MEKQPKRQGCMLLKHSKYLQECVFERFRLFNICCLFDCVGVIVFVSVIVTLYQICLFDQCLVCVEVDFGGYPSRDFPDFWISSVHERDYLR